MPERIQRKRTKGWRMPEGAVYVGRPTRWGNPYEVGRALYGETDETGSVRFVRTRAEAVALYRERCEWHTGTYDGAPRAAEALRGKDLVCWCPLDQPCHADVLLEWANTPQQPTCRMCESRYPHFPQECGIPCEGAEPHDVVATYRHSGFWRGECRRCRKVWEVDSSG